MADKKVYFSAIPPGNAQSAYLRTVASALAAEGYRKQHWGRIVTREDDGMPEIFLADRAALLGANLAVILQGSARADVEQILAAEHNVPHVVVYPPDFQDQDPFVYHATARYDGPLRWGWQVGTLGLDEVMESIRTIFRG